VTIRKLDFLKGTSKFAARNEGHYAQPKLSSGANCTVSFAKRKVLVA